MGEDDQKVKKLNILEELEDNPQIKQKDLASRLGIAVGTVNWYIKRLANKGLVKVKRIGQWKWKYILTPKGMKEKAKLTKDYINRSMDLYRETRDQARNLVSKVKGRGYDKLHLQGKNDLVDVCRLTCMEQGVEVVDGPENEKPLPVLKVVGRELDLQWPEDGRGDESSGG